MFASSQFRKAYADSVLSDLEGRKEWYKKSGQHVVITYNPVSGHKLPMLAKFPRLSSYFRRFPQDSPYRNHSEGLFNGMYYIPRQFEERALPIGDTHAGNKYGCLDPEGLHFDFKNKVKRSPGYNVLLDAYTRVPENLSVSKVNRVTLKNEAARTNFRTNPGLKQNGK